MALDPISAIRCTPFAAALLLIVSASACSTQDERSEAGEPLDILILDARIVDGAGNPWFRGDVGIRGDKIVEVGYLEGRHTLRTIDAADRVVSPGFIDMMSQSSQVLVTDPPSAESKLRQGITTYLSGVGLLPPCIAHVSPGPGCGLAAADMTSGSSARMARNSSTVVASMAGSWGTSERAIGTSPTTPASPIFLSAPVASPATR
jgi:adenine deaminase